MHKSTIIKSLFLKREPSFRGLSEIFSTVSCIKSQKALDSVARDLIETVRRVRLLRDSHLSDQLTRLLLTLPASEGVRSAIGFYDRLSQPDAPADIDKARETLFRAADSAESGYAPRIILEIACTYDRQDNVPEALRYYAEAGRAAAGADYLVTLSVAQNTASLRSNEGDHLGALRDLEGLWPLVLQLSHHYAHVHHQHLNDLAVVLSRAGRITESRAAIARALSSPLAFRFPEWRETQREIDEAAQKQPRRSAPRLTMPAPGARKRAAEVEPRKARRRGVRKSPQIFLLGIVHQAQATEVKSGDSNIVSSLLERYVKSVRIRDSPADQQ